MEVQLRKFITLDITFLDRNILLYLNLPMYGYEHKQLFFIK